MVDVKKLYGVLTGFTARFLIVESEVYLKPSREMLGELAELPAGTKVGIEDFEPDDKRKLDDLVIDDARVIVNEATQKYWNEVEEHCKKHRLEVVCLDDATIWAEAAKAGLEAHRLSRQFGKAMGARLVELQRTAYAQEVIQEYLHGIGREEAIIRKIKSRQPEVVLVSAGFADDLAARPSHGINFAAYAQEQGPKMDNLTQDMRFVMSEMMSRAEAEDFLNRNVEPNTLVQNSSPDPATAAEREALERRYRAVKTGRITDRKPDFIGTWELLVPARGLFELFVTGRAGKSIVGTIEDTIGPATFTGTMDENGIRFTKTYAEHTYQIRGPIPPCKGEIAYSAEKTGNKLEGLFDHPDARGRFEMAEFK